MRQQLILYSCPKSFHLPGSPWRTLAKCTNAKKKNKQRHHAAPGSVPKSGNHRLRAIDCPLLRTSFLGPIEFLSPESPNHPGVFKRFQKFTIPT